MLEAFQQFISKNHLCSKKDKILIAVSSGIDSVVLLNLFYSAGYAIAIAHCNFKLRDEESDQDEIFVRELAKKYKIGINVKTCDASAYAGSNKCSIQEAARELRYQWFEDVCQLKGYDKVAVAQHIDDQVETFFINLLRGSGVDGLKGMPLRRGKIIRPLLFANRSDIEQYAKEKKLDFREDSSNSSDKYLRNQIRHQLLSQLAKIKTDYRSLIGSSLQKLTEDHQMLAQFIQQMKGDLFDEQKGVIKIQIEELLEQINLQVLLFYLLKDFGFNRDVTDSIYEAALKRQSGKMFHSMEYQLLIDRDFLILKKAIPIIEDEIYFIKSAYESIETPISLKLEIVEKPDNLQINTDSFFAYFDLDQLNFPLVIRKWRMGDRFTPFGMKGSKLVSDFLIDQKLDRFEKENIYMLESGGEIAWVIGYRVSDKFRIIDKTKQVIIMKLNK